MNLVQGLPLFEIEVGKSDIILTSSSFGLSSRKEIAFNSFFGQEAARLYKDLPAAMTQLRDMRSKGIKNRRYGMLYDPSSASYNRGTLLGVWQTKYDFKDNCNNDLIIWSLSVIQFWAADYDRVAVELPGEESGVDDEHIAKALRRMPSHVVFYRGVPKTQEEIEREKFMATTRTSYGYGFHAKEQEAYKVTK